MVTVCASVSVCASPYPSSQASQLPACAGRPSPVTASTPAEDVHGEMDPVSKPPFVSSCCDAQLEAALIVQVKEADPVAPVVSLAVTVTLFAAAVVGVPVISPVVELIDRPAGSPVAL